MTKKNNIGIVKDRHSILIAWSLSKPFPVLSKIDTKSHSEFNQRLIINM